MVSNKVLIPFRFPGGKFYAIKTLRLFWESIKHDEYREPFAGGATLFFSKPLVKYNWLNDIDSNLMTTYRAMAEPKLREELVNLLKNEIASKERWLQIREMQPRSDLEVAFRHYYMNRTSFSGKLSSPAWGYRPKRSLPPERWAERIIPCGQKLEHIKLTCMDFSNVINMPAQGSDVLMYIDPPYFTPPRKKHYMNGFTREDHIRLCKLLKSTSYKFFLTYEDVTEIREMYKWANIYPMEFFYRVDNSQTQFGKRRKGRELVITNFKIARDGKLNDFE